MTIEIRLKHLEEKLLKELSEIKKILITKHFSEKWILQAEACSMLNISPRRMRDIRIHSKNGKSIGTIRWRKGKGKTIQYFKPDLEKYLDRITIA